MSESQQRLRTAVFGATGVAGGGVVHACLNDPRVEEVRAVTRRTLSVTGEKLREVRCNDFVRLNEIGDALVGVDTLCFCLDISASQVSGEAEYRVITHDYALAAALALKAASPEATFHFLSGSGTNAKSRMMWARVKGETELELQKLGLGGIVCWRPGMILADRLPRRIPRDAFAQIRAVTLDSSRGARPGDAGSHLDGAARGHLGKPRNSGSGRALPDVKHAMYGHAHAPVLNWTYA